MRIVLTCAASALLSVACACTASEPMDAPSTTGEADATSSGGGSTAPATTDLDLTSSGDSVAGSDSTAAMTSASPTSDTGPVPPSEPRYCSLDALDPSVDPATVLDYGDGEGQIPTEIGEALLRNCGCHYSDELPPGFVDYMSNAQPISTLADFHDTFKGFFPVGFSEMPAYEAIEERVVHSNPLPMPPHGCDVEGEDGLITMADLALFAEWLAAAAPDGATWPMR